MEEFWIYCEICDEECPHEVLKSRTSSKYGFSFQGVVKCLECDTIGSKEIKEEPPIELRLRISDDNQTKKDILIVDKDVTIKVGDTRPHPDGLILITGLEIGNKRPNHAYSQDNPVVWAKKATHAKIRFAIHDGESTISVKQEFLSSEEFKVGMKIRIEGRMARIKAINLFGGKSVKRAYALEISRITCLYLSDRESGINRNKKNAR
tara:strand:- start:1895 stop:2515 length:621 start_codon:yes stop_codon:yes gene_type:complete